MAASWVVVGCGLSASWANGARGVRSDGVRKSRAFMGGVRRICGHLVGGSSGEEGTVMIMAAGGGTGSPNPAFSLRVSMGPGGAYYRARLPQWDIAMSAR